MMNATNADRVLLSVFHSAVFVVGLPGNVLVLIAFCLSREFRSRASTVCLIMMTIADLITCVCAVPYYTIGLLVENFHKSSPMYTDLCKVSIFIITTAGIVRILTFTVMSVDRFIAVAHPYYYANHCSRSKVLILACYIWVHASLSTLPTVVVDGWMVYNARNEAVCRFTSPPNSLTYTAPMVIFNFALPTITVMIMNAKVFIIARKQLKRVLSEGEKFCSLCLNLNKENSARKHRELEDAPPGITDSVKRLKTVPGSREKIPSIRIEEASEKISSMEQVMTDKHQRHPKHFTQVGQKTVSYNDEVMSKNDRMMSNDHRVMSKDDKVMSNNHRVMSSNDRMMSNDDKVMSNNHIVMSKDDKVMSNNHIVMSKDDKVMSKDDKVMSKDDKVMSNNHRVMSNGEEVSRKRKSIVLSRRSSELRKKFLNNQRVSLDKEARPRNESSINGPMSWTRRHSTMFKNHNTRCKHSTSRRNAREIVIALSTLILAFAFILTWAPFVVTRLVITIWKDKNSPRLQTYTSASTVLNSGLNPIIILLTRKEVRKILLRKLLRRRVET